ncbi:MAG: CRISPR-associated endonuclease Cas1 [Tissierellia bacterium]|nr:CRISPR-associated endonuclease Cas1 [Tissierellia bacterium]
MILYLTEQGATAKVDEGQIVIECKDGLVRKIPKELVDTVTIFGQVQLSHAFQVHCLTRGIPIAYLSIHGKYFGRTISTSQTNILRLKEQIRMSSSEQFCLEFGKIIINAKLNNQITILRRYRHYCDEVLSDINEIIKYKRGIDRAESLNQINGYEGIAARSYWRGISKVLPKEFQFDGRSRRPPKDPFNSMISLGYTLLLNEITAYLEQQNLSPFCGFMHQDHDGHPSLASDLIEEWRAVVVDSYVIHQLLNGKVNPEDFEKMENGGILINSKYLKLFLKGFEDKLNTSQKYLAYINEPISFRRALYQQVLCLVRAIEAGDPSLYSPINIR